MRNSKERLSELIQVSFRVGGHDVEQFPYRYQNDVAFWGNIPKDKLHSCLPDGTAKMFQMGVDIGNVCGLDCSACFRRDKRFDKMSKKNALTHEEIVGYVREAKETLGLEQIKVLGRGEPFQNPRFLEFLEEVVGMGVGVSIFTKGHVLGSNWFTKRYNKRYGITTAWELIERLRDLKLVSILLGFNSFDHATQERFVGVDKYPRFSLLRRYVEFRDQALLSLSIAGFNNYRQGETTKLALVAAPIKPENIEEIFDLYTWARERNIYMVSCPTNISGKGVDEFKRAGSFEGYKKRLEDLWVQIYIWNIRTGLTHIGTFIEDGPGLYPGCHPCNETAAGFYLNLSGQVNQCPGRCDASTIYSQDIRKDGLMSVWKGSLAYKRAKHGKAFNYKCQARDGHSLPTDFYSNIKRRVLAELGV